MAISTLLRKYRPAILLIGCLTALIIGFVIRTQKLDLLIPFESDERAWLLMGTSLLQKGTPASWTIYWSKYPHRETIRYGGKDHLVVTPFLDHPPLFGLGMGVWATLTDNNTYKPLNWAVLRLPMIWLALCTLIITWLFIKKLFGPIQATITLVAFSFFPAHIIASRFIVAENVIAFFLILCLYAFSVIDTKNNKNSNKTKLATTVIVTVCSLVILLKLSAIIIPASIGLLALLRKKWLLFWEIIVATIISIALFMLYGAYYNWEIFLSVLNGHTTRVQSYWHFWSIFTQMDLGYFPMRDPTFIVGMIGLFVLLANSKIAWEKRLYIFSPLLNLSLLFLFIAPVESYGWYKFICFPLLAIGLGYVLTELAKGEFVYYILLLPFVAVMLEQSNLIKTHSHQNYLVLVAFGTTVATVVAKHYFPKIKLPLQVNFLLLVALLFFLELTWVKILIPH